MMADLFFIAARIGAFVTDLSVVTMALFCLSLATLAQRRRRAAGVFLSTGMAIALGVGAGPVGALLLRPLENRFAAAPPPADVAGIIVLGGAINVHETLSRGILSFGPDGARLYEGIRLGNAYPEARMVFTGGSGALLGPRAPEAHLVEPLFQAMLRNPDRALFEDRSRNTYENALFTRDLTRNRPGTWLLVTSAFHMPRAMGVFRQLGFDVTPFPVAYRTANDLTDWALSAPTLFSGAVHEWLGLAIYWASGRSTALFPGPSPGK